MADTTRRPGAWHNLGTVIAFEVRRTLKRRSFWAMTLAVPALMLAISALVIFSNGSAMKSVDASQRQQVPFTYTDASGLIDPTIAAKSGGTPTSDADAARAAVVAGKADLFIAYPADPSKQTIEVAGRDKGIAQPTDYAGIARSVLLASAKEKVSDAKLAGVLTGTPRVHELTYADGRVAPGVASVILPGAFLVLFYLAIIMLGNQMLNITVEEKENRVTEMILTTIQPTTLILGKLLALVAVGLVQTLVLIGPMLVLPGLIMTLLGANLPSSADLPPDALPSMADLASAINPPAIAVGALLFLGAFLMFTGLLVSIGAIMPTAKDAGSAFGTIVIALFLPFYAMGILMADPHGVASQVLTFFPLTSPVTAMVRNATGTLYPWETAVTLVLIYGFAALFLALGVRLFRTGSISYNAKLDIRKVFSSRRG